MSKKGALTLIIEKGAIPMAEKKTITVTFELDDSRTIAGAFEDLEDITGLRIVAIEFYAPDHEDGGCDD